jgi:hydrogenase expression/formation protein HypE
LGTALTQNAKDFYSQISIVKDAITAYKTGGVHAMHDPTEGGVAGGIHEMADAAGLGVKVAEEKIVILPETAQICRHFKVDPLQLISSGALLIAAEAGKAEKIVESLHKQRVHAEVIGEFLQNPNQRFLEGKTGEAKVLPRPKSDHLWKALSRQ